MGSVVHIFFTETQPQKRMIIRSLLGYFNHQMNMVLFVSCRPTIVYATLCLLFGLTKEFWMIYCYPSLPWSLTFLSSLWDILPHLAFHNIFCCLFFLFCSVISSIGKYNSIVPFSSFLLLDRIFNTLMLGTYQEGWWWQLLYSQQIHIFSTGNGT